MNIWHTILTFLDNIMQTIKGFIYNPYVLTFLDNIMQTIKGFIYNPYVLTFLDNIMQTIKGFIYNPYVLTLVTGIIVIYIVNRQNALKAFKSIWISSKKLKYSDLSGRKKLPEKNPSTQNHLEKEVQNLLDHNKNVLIISEAKAGKTHFTVNFLNKLKNTYLLIPESDKFDQRFDFIPKAPKNANYKIVLLDDAHNDFKKATRLGSFIEKAIDEGYIIWANTISGDDFEIVRNAISSKLLSTFNNILIPSTLDETEALKIGKSLGIYKLPPDYLGNIGDITSDTNQLKNKYDYLCGIEKLLLLVIKQLYLIGVYRSHSKILKSDIQKLIKIYEPNESISKHLDELKKKGFLLNCEDPRNICFEERYLKKIVAPNLKVKEFMKNISEIFPKNVAIYTQAMQSASNYDEAVDIYQEMRSNNIQPHNRPFSVLIRRANDSDIGLIWLKEMDKLGVPLDDFIINALLCTMQGDIKKKERVISELKLRKVEISKNIKNYLEAPRIQFNLNSYNNLMNLSENYDKALELFNEIIEKRIEPIASNYSTLMNLSRDYDKALELFNEMMEKGIVINAVVYNILMKLSNDQNKGKELFNEMIEKGIKPNEATYNTLMNLFCDYDKVLELFEEITVKHSFADTKINFQMIRVLDKKNISSCQINNFFKKHKKIISSQNDSVINFYAVFFERHLEVDKIESLLKNIKEENWKTCNIKGNLYREINTEKSKNFYKRALNLVDGDSYNAKAMIHNNIARLIRKKMIVKEYKDAIEHCHLGLNNQSISNTKIEHYLLYGLLMLTISISKTDSLKGDLEKLQQRYNISKTVIKDIRRNIGQISNKEKRGIVKQFFNYNNN